MADFSKRHRHPDDLTDPFYEDGTVDYDRVQGNNPLAGGEYPKALYRAGGREEIHGHMVDTVIVGSEAEEEARTSDGWRATPAKAAALGKQLIAEESAKPDPRDEEIARLRAELAQRSSEPTSDQPKRRGRPPNSEREPIASEIEQA